jgi:hypothetical protein
MASSDIPAWRRYIQGHYPLWVVFWLGYVLPAVLFITGFKLLFSFALSAAPGSPIFLFARPVIMLAGAIFLSFTYLAMWRSAINVSIKPLGYLARVWIVMHSAYFVIAFAFMVATLPQTMAAIG